MFLAEIYTSVQSSAMQSYLGIVDQKRLSSFWIGLTDLPTPDQFVWNNSLVEVKQGLVILVILV
jgi:hypothetical protein